MSRLAVESMCASVAEVAGVGVMSCDCDEAVSKSLSLDTVLVLAAPFRGEVAGVVRLDTCGEGLSAR